MQVETVETKGFEAGGQGRQDKVIRAVLSEVKSLHASLHVLFACSQPATLSGVALEESDCFKLEGSPVSDC